MYYEKETGCVWCSFRHSCTFSVVFVKFTNIEHGFIFLITRKWCRKWQDSKISLVTSFELWTFSKGRNARNRRYPQTNIFQTDSHGKNHAVIDLWVWFVYILLFLVFCCLFTLYDTEVKYSNLVLSYFSLKWFHCF